METSTLIKALGDGASSKAGRQEGRRRLTVYGNCWLGITFLGNRETVSLYRPGLFPNLLESTVLTPHGEPGRLHPLRDLLLKMLHKQVSALDVGETGAQEGFSEDSGKPKKQSKRSL